MKRARAFTLIEVMIVVVLLGVLAAIVIPGIARSSTTARQTVLASNLGLLRRFVLLYKSHHLEVAPGYPNGDTSASPSDAVFDDQGTLASNRSGQTATPGTPGYPFGPYLSRIPTNPFNRKDTVQMLAPGDAFPAAADDSHGWIFKPSTGEIRPDNTGNDENGIAFYDY